MMVALAALSNNSYNANNLFSRPTGNGTILWGLHSREIIVVKYGTAAILLLFSFICSSTALSNLIDANLLINCTLDIDEEELLRLCYGSCSIKSYTTTMLERGFVMAVAGSRLLCIAFPLMLWMLSPVLVLLSSIVLVWGLHALDFNNWSINLSLIKPTDFVTPFAQFMLVFGFINIHIHC